MSKEFINRFLEVAKEVRNDCVDASVRCEELGWGDKDDYWKGAISQIDHVILFFEEHREEWDG